jgi:FkbM family methyltransferase
MRGVYGIRLIYSNLASGRAVGGRVGMIRRVIGGLKRGAARFACQPLVGKIVLGLFGDSVPGHGLRFDLGRDPDPRLAARLAWGLYESAEVRFVNGFLRAKLDVVELGGSLGVVASVIGSRIGSRRLVIVEAAPELAPLIRTNVSRNAPAAAVEVVSAVLDYDVTEGTEVPFLFARDTTAGRVDRTGESGAGVPAIQLSSLLDRHLIEDYALVCDVEGAEWGLLDRDMPALDRCRQLIIEFHDAPPPRIGRAAVLRERLLETGDFIEVGRRGSVSCFERCD